MICVVSHDAGGAEVLASYLNHKKLKCLYVLSGPAISIFERRFGKLVMHSLEDAIAKCEKVLCSTSWQSDVEWNAIRLARIYGKHSIAFLDHWVNYNERFIRSRVLQLPDEIYVGDFYAKKIANQCFPGQPIKLIPNFYFKEIKNIFHVMKNSVRSKSVSSGTNILYVCEPLSEHGLMEYADVNHWGYTEFDALRYFLDNVRQAIKLKIDNIIIRPHPSEKKGKYDWVLSEYGEYVRLGGDKTLYEEVLVSDLIVGCESMAMVVGLIAGRCVISCVPPGGLPSQLPQRGILNFQDLINNGELS